MTDLLHALVLGVVEGLTEFLPISSTGHLIIVSALLGESGEKSKVFIIVIQLAAILAVCWEYRLRLTRVALGLRSDPAARRFVVNLVVAFLPAAVLGVLFHSAIKSALFHAVPVALALALPSLAYLVWAIALNGADIAVAVEKLTLQWMFTGMSSSMRVMAKPL